MWFTGKGDDGTTYTFRDDRRVPKDDPLIEVLGALDELNSCLGVCRALADKLGVCAVSGVRVSDIVKEIQEDLFVIQSELAGSSKSLAKKSIRRIEKVALDQEKVLPPLTSFIIPGSTVLSAHLDLARSISRRVERRFVSLQNMQKSRVTSAYLNRLSSTLFALARMAADQADCKEHSPHY